MLANILGGHYPKTLPSNTHISAVVLILLSVMLISYNVSTLSKPVAVYVLLVVLPMNALINPFLYTIKWTTLLRAFVRYNA